MKTAHLAIIDTGTNGHYFVQAAEGRPERILLQVARCVPSIPIMVAYDEFETLEKAEQVRNAILHRYHKDRIGRTFLLNKTKEIDNFLGVLKVPQSVQMELSKTPEEFDTDVTGYIQETARHARYMQKRRERYRDSESFREDRKARSKEWYEKNKNTPEYRAKKNAQQRAWRAKKKASEARIELETLID